MFLKSFARLRVLGPSSYKCAFNICYQDIKFKHKDLQYLKSVPNKDEGIKVSVEHDLFKWGQNKVEQHKQNMSETSSNEGQESEYFIIDENSEDIDEYKENPDDEWATNILGKFVPNEDTLEKIYGDTQMSFSEIPICFIKTSQNNTIIDVRDPKPPSPFASNEEKKAHTYEQLCYSSCGVEGFKNAKKGTNIAGQAVGLSVAIKCLQKGVALKWECRSLHTGNTLKYGIKMVRVVVQGLGPGRMASLKGLQMGGMQIISITDNTPIPFNGQRPRKQRKV